MIDQIKSPFLYSRLLFVFVFAALGLTLVRCDKWVKPENETQISTHGDDESVDDDHQFNGLNCMNCHYTEGRGEGWFTVAGTVQGSFDTGYAKIYTDFTQPPIMTVEIDAMGNFYTTEDIDFSNGLNVSIVKSSGLEYQMNDKIYTGQCSLCHGVTTSHLYY